MNIARAARPASVALAVGASALLIAGMLPAGLVIGVAAVAVAWLRPPAPPAD